MATVTLTIDGKQITVPQGTTVLNAAKDAGIPVPVFCYHGELDPIGACRMCLVEIEKMPKLAISCATVAAEGMIVQTKNDKVLKAQKGMLEFLLINHPLDCPVCDKGGECELQDNTFSNGPGASRFIDTKRRFEKQNLNELIRLDMNRCIMCRRCVRTCNDLQGQGVLGVVERGYRSEIAMFQGAESHCTYCGDCIEACPVGALTSIPFRFKARVWELKRTDTVCTYCADGCRLTLETRDQNILRARARLTPGEYLSTDHPCVKGHFGHEFVSSDKRIKNPLLRKNGQLVEVEWDEAISYIGSQVSSIKKTNGGNSFGVLASVRTTNEEQYLTSKFAREVLGTENIDHLLTPKGTFTNDSFKKLSGQPAKLEDIVNAQAIVLIGANIEITNPFTRLRVIKSVSQKQGQLITIHPHDTGLRGYITHEIRPAYNTEPETVQKLASGPQTTIDSSDINEAASILFNAENRVILFGPDVINHPRREDYLSSIENLVAKLNATGKGTTKVLWLAEYNNSRGALDFQLTPGNNGLTFSGMLDSVNSGKIKSLFIQGENPVLRANDKQSAIDTLKKLEFLVVQDLFLTETAELAHVVLPAVSFAEKDGTFTNVEGLVQKIKAAFPPREEAKPDWWILTQIARSLGATWDYNSPEQISEEISKLVKGFQTVNYLELGRDGNYISYPQEPVPAQSKTISSQVTALGDSEFYLYTGNVLIHSGTMSRYANTLLQLSEKAFASIPRVDARRLNIKDGQVMTIESPKGKLTLPAKITKHQAAGTIFVPSNFTEAPVNTLFGKDDTTIKVKLKI